MKKIISIITITLLLFSCGKKEETAKEKFQGTIYFIFYILVAVEAATGMMLKFELAGEDILEKAEEIHKLAIYWMPGFIVLHFVGITIAELTNKKGIVSKMIGGE